MLEGRFDKIKWWKTINKLNRKVLCTYSPNHNLIVNILKL